MSIIKSYQQLETMCNISALSGFEENMIRYFKSEMSQSIDDVRVDKLGNVICRLPGTDPDAPKVMIFAHMDEVGFIVRNIEEDGFVRISRVGGIPEKSMPAQRLLLNSAEGDVFGIIGPKSHHLTPPEDKYKVVTINDSYIDIGVRSKKEAEAMGIIPGVSVTYAGFYQDMPNGRFVGKAIDNRGGCFTLLQLGRLLSQKPHKATIYLVGSVQEEFNIRGVVTAGYTIQPDMAFAIDVCLACDTPDLKDHTAIQLGNGPSVGHFSFHGRGTLNGLIPNPKLLQFVIQCASDEDIPLQHNVFLGGLCDSSYLAVLRDGIPCVDIGFPARYTHAPVEMASKYDLENLVKLLDAVLLRIDETLDLSRG